MVLTWDWFLLRSPSPWQDVTRHTDNTPITPPDCSGVRGQGESLWSQTACLVQCVTVVSGHVSVEDRWVRGLMYCRRWMAGMCTTTACLTVHVCVNIICVCPSRHVSTRSLVISSFSAGECVQAPIRVKDVCVWCLDTVWVDSPHGSILLWDWGFKC